MNSAPPPPPPRTSSRAAGYEYSAPPLDQLASSSSQFPSLPSSSSSQLPPQDQHLPTYDESESPRGGGGNRFGRYRSWIEKRGNERREEREELKRSGKYEKSSWDLPDVDGSSRGGRSNEVGVPAGGGGGLQLERQQEEELVQLRRKRYIDQEAEKRLSGSSQFTLSNPDVNSTTTTRPSLNVRTRSSDKVGRSRASSNASTSTRGGGGKGYRLTANCAMEQIGGRFDRGLPQKPLCAMVLPTQDLRSQKDKKKRSEGDDEDRFLLIGTAQGLYLADLTPSLTTSGPLLRTPTASTSPSARILPLWIGLGVYNLSHVLEPSGNSSRSKGLVVALVGSEGASTEVRMWSLTAIVSLANWRAFNETAEPLDLAPIRTSIHLSPTKTDHARKSSFGALKSFLGPSPPPPSSKSSSPSTSSSPVFRQSSVDSQYIFDPHSPAQACQPDSPSKSPSTPNQQDSLPLEWANAFVRLPLPKGHTPVLFFKISNIPTQPQSSSYETGDRIEDSDDSDDSNEDLTNEQQRRKEREREERDRLFLLVATKGVVYVFESGRSDKRSWVLTRELSAPSTPRFFRLIRSPLASHDPSTHSRSHSTASTKPITSTSSLSHSYPSDLCLFLGMSSRSVLIRLDDYSVQEIDLPSTPLPHTYPTSRSRTKSLSNSIHSTTSIASSHHRSSKKPSSISFSFPKDLRDNAIISKLSGLVIGDGGGKSSIPAGMRGGGEKEIVIGRKVETKGSRKSEEMSRIGSNSSASMGSRDDLHLLGDRGKWIGCEEIFVRGMTSNGNARTRRLVLLSQGHFTHVLSTTFVPIGVDSGSMTAPIWTFHWSNDLDILEIVHFLVEPSHSTSTTSPRLPLLVLVAFTRTGLTVQQGFVSLDSIDESSPNSFESNRSSSRRPFFTPTPSSTDTKTSNVGSSPGEEEDEEDLASTATLDFGRDAGYLCDSLAGSRSVTPRGDTQRTSGYMFRKTASDFVIDRICVR